MAAEEITTEVRVDKAKSAVRDLEMDGIAQARRSAGKRVYNLNIGDPVKSGDIVPPLGFRIKRSLEVLRKRGYAYAPAPGVVELQKAVAEDAQARGIRDAKPDNVVVGAGVSEIVNFLSGLALGRGKNILVPRPDYYLYSSLARYYDGEVRYYDLEPEKGWQPNLEQIRRQIDERTAAVVVINPNNPTGSTNNEETLRRLIRVVGNAGKNRIPIISDEIYRHLVFPKGRRKSILSRNFAGRHTSIAAMTDEVPVITLDGVSKNFYAPGVRIGHAMFSNFGQRSGWLKAMKSLCAARLAAPHDIQYTYADAIRTRTRWWNRLAYNRRLVEVQKRSEYAAKRLDGIGFKVSEPQGAFYLLPRLSSEMRKVWNTDKEFARELLEKTGIWVVPASGFAMKPEDGYFRVVSLPPVKQQKRIFDEMAAHVRRKLAEAKSS
ncbi:MAG: aminotransferase class I/II-fold pyridoxal phosphate-dependent enzyme [Candidatus Micrarchaeota archaeon]